jgi:23S rRNA-intervening sequence protein
MRDHTKYKAFQLADALVISVYLMTKSFPREEIYGLSSQMRRAAISIPSNIDQELIEAEKVMASLIKSIKRGSVKN